MNNCKKCHKHPSVYQGRCSHCLEKRSKFKKWVGLMEPIDYVVVTAIVVFFGGLLYAHLFLVNH